MFKIVDPNLTMDELLASSVEYKKPELGSLIEGTVVTVTKNRLIVDLNDGMAVGMASGKRETHDAAGSMKDLRAGDKVKAVVIDVENDEGAVELSLKQASRDLTWERFEKAYKDGEVIQVVVTEANKGGLLVETDGIKGFLPVSQLAPENYPRVANANAAEILTRLKGLVRKSLSVKVLSIERPAKLILSEKAAGATRAKASLGELKEGAAVTGRVSGVVNFGIFVTFNGLEGLVHISEIDWGHVSDPHQHAKVGDEVKVKIIGIEGEKLSLSMKRLMPDPWSVIEEKYPIGVKVKGVINRFSPFGAFVQLDGGINGLIHLSEISNKKVEDPADFLTIGQEVEATVINIDSDERRIGLSLKGRKEKMKDETDDITEEAEAVKAEKEEKKEKKKPAAKKKAEEVAEAA